jgi:hypothetical protein
MGGTFDAEIGARFAFISEKYQFIDRTRNALGLREEDFICARRRPSRNSKSPYGVMRSLVRSREDFGQRVGICHAGFSDHKMRIFRNGILPEVITSGMSAFIDGCLQILSRSLHSDALYSWILCPSPNPLNWRGEEG